MKLKEISRRIIHAERLPGSKTLHQFLDIGIEGKLLVRPRPCHFCPGCMALDPEAIINDCINKARCGQAVIVTLKATSPSEIPEGANAIAQAGQQLSAAAAAGDFVAVELAFQAVPWMMAKVVGDVVTYSGVEKEEWIGVVKPGDQLLCVERWMPLETGGGSSIFEKARGDPVNVFTNDVRFLISKAEANGDSFKLRRQSARVAGVVQENLRCVAGTEFEYMFADRPGQWFLGKVRGINEDGTTADVLFNDGDEFLNLPVFGALHGARLRIVSGGALVPGAHEPSPQRRLLPATKEEIQARVC